MANKLTKKAWQNISLLLLNGIIFKFSKIDTQPQEISPETGNSTMAKTATIKLQVCYTFIWCLYLHGCNGTKFEYYNYIWLYIYDYIYNCMVKFHQHNLMLLSWTLMFVTKLLLVVVVVMMMMTMMHDFCFFCFCWMDVDDDDDDDDDEEEEEEENILLRSCSNRWRSNSSTNNYSSSCFLLHILLTSQSSD